MASSLNDEEARALQGVEPYVNADRLAELINKSYPVTLRMLRKKQIKGTRHGTEWRVKLSEVRRFLEHGNHPDSEQTGDDNDS